MRYLIHLALLLALCSTQAMASSEQLVELMVFRQSADSLQASRVAPDNWADAATPVTRAMQRSTQLDLLAKKLIPENGYQVVLHTAWLQNSDNASSSMAVHAGDKHFAHYPIEGTLTFAKDRNTVQLDLWINQFNSDKTLRSSERFKQKIRIAHDQVTFIDHSTLGALIRIQTQGTTQAVSPHRNAEDFE